jgi:tetratricopeptide (TPR) repeat protein
MWGPVELGARVLRGRLAHLRGHLDHADSLLGEAAGDAAERGAVGLELEALLALSAVHIRRHEFDAAEQALDRVRGALGAMERPSARGLLDAGQLLVRGHLWAERGRLEEARGAFVESMSIFRGADQEGRLGEARCLSALGLIAQMEGLYARSERRLKQAVSMAEVAGSGYALVQAVPLAMLALRVHDTWRARTMAVAALEHTVRLGMDAEAALLRLVLGVACAMDGDLPAWVAARAHAMSFFELHRWHSPELEALLAMADGGGPRQRAAQPGSAAAPPAMV